MKVFFRIIIWTLLAVVVQQSIFLYIENVYLQTDYDITVEKVEEPEETEEKKNEEIELSSGVTGIEVSSDGRFAAYMKDGQLKVLDSKENIEKDFTTENDGQVVYYKWLTNEDSMIVIQKVKERSGSYFEPVSYSAKKGEARNLTDINYNEVKIDISNSEDTVDNVIFSNATHTLYIKIAKSNGLSDLYYANIMNQLSLVRSNKNIGNIIVPTTNSNCVMEMGDFATILNSPDNIEIPNVEITKVLGADINDNVYFGEEVNGKITKIHYTVLNTEKNKWNTLTLSSPVDKEDITIDYSGKIYINDSVKKTVTELIGGSSVKYEGDFVQIYSKGAISKLGNKLIKNEIEDKRLLKAQ